METPTQIRLYTLPTPLRWLLFLTVFNITVGTGVGLYYVAQTTHLSPEGTTEQFSGSNTETDFDIPEKYPKPVSELLTTTHNHILSLTLISLILGGIFFFNSTISGSIKSFLILEPFISILLTFGGIWLVRFIQPLFVYVVMLSGILMYSCYFIMAGVILYELGWKKK